VFKTHFQFSIKTQNDQIPTEIIIKVRTPIYDVDSFNAAARDALNAQNIVIVIAYIELSAHMTRALEIRENCASQN